MKLCPSQPPPSWSPMLSDARIRSSIHLITAGLLAAQILATPQASYSALSWRDPSPHQVRSISVDSSVHLEVLDWGGLGHPVVLLACYLTAHVYDDFAPKLAA